MDLRSVSSLPSKQVQAQLERIAHSRQFRNAPRLSRFLTYVVEQCLAGQSDRLKGYTIGVEVFDKEDDFDPQTDTIVRVQARALRQKLGEYYLQAGADDPLHIVIAKGGYEPTFFVPGPNDAPQAVDPPPSPVTTKPSIAVLPFEHIGPKSDYDFLSSGLTEGTISSLSRFKDLSVFSRSTTQKAKSEGMSIAQMYAAFQPDFILEGSFSIREDIVETLIRLIAATTDEVIMTDHIDIRMDPSHIYEMQDDMVARMAARIAVEYGPIGQYAQEAIRTGPAIKWETYAWISRYFQHGFQLDQAGRDTIEAGLTHALTADPTSADAHAALSMIQIEHYRAMTAECCDPDRLDAAMKHALLAVRHDPQSAMAHQALALAYFHEKRLVDFRASVRRALCLNPGHSDMLAMFGLCFVRCALWDDAIPLLDRALELNPLHPNWYHMPKAMFLMMTDGAEKAIEEIIKAPMPDVFAFHFILLWFRIEAGDMEAAEVEKERLLTVTPDVEAFARRYFEAVCLCDEIADRAIAALRKVGLHIAD